MISLDSSEEEPEPAKRPKAKVAAAPKKPAALAAAAAEEPEGKYLVSQLEQYKMLYEYAIAKLKEQK